MRRFLVCVLICLMVVPAAQAAELMKASEALFAQMQERTDGRASDSMAFYQSDVWFSAVATFKDRNRFTEYVAIVYDTVAEAAIAWDDLFEDGDAAAQRMVELGQASTYTDAYAEYHEMDPVPRDNFALREGQLIVYYPPEQYSYFSGRSGALAFYAYELEGLLKEGIPLVEGDVAQAKAALEAALAEGKLPGALAPWAIGGTIQAAADTLGLVDVPDMRDQYAVWYFEAPEMRSVALLSQADEIQTASAPIRGIYTERMDFSGLQTGVSTVADCLLALGDNDGRMDLTDADDAYALMPAGVRLIWENDTYQLTLNFVDDVLHGIMLTDKAIGQ